MISVEYFVNFEYSFGGKLWLLDSIEGREEPAINRTSEPDGCEPLLFSVKFELNPPFVAPVFGAIK